MNLQNLTDVKTSGAFVYRRAMWNADIWNR